jgi:hypothetical protein
MVDLTADSNSDADDAKAPHQVMQVACMVLKWQCQSKHDKQA